MKILYHHRTLADGAEGIHILEMIEAFRANGHEVVVRAMAHGSGRGAGHQGFLKQLKAMLPAGAFELAAVGSSVMDYVTFGRALRRHRPDFVYKRHALNDVGVALAARHHRVPLILEVNRLYAAAQHTRFERLTLTGLARFFERLAINQASVVAAVSTPLAGGVRALATDPGKVMVLPNGANPVLFQPNADVRQTVRQQLAWDDSVIVGWAGILREWHGVDLLLQAVAGVPGLKLLIIGDGPDRERLESVIQRLNIAGRVMFTGRVSHADVVRYIGAVDIAVSAADRTGYASPMKLLEYMAMERATVAPRSANIEDLIDHDVDGLLFEPDNKDALMAALRRLALDEALRLRLGSQARIKVTHFRNWRRNAQIVVRAVADAAAPRGVSPAQQLGSQP
ncbi:MAG: glycosyltransferase family 1 protein [Acidobacteria bacterium]|nr:MAG: glycosyltransferase family 1 protein [Acidobacteriota bacterium]